MLRAISVFGATGSVGQSTFDLLMRQGGPASYRTVALTGGRNVARLDFSRLAQLTFRAPDLVRFPALRLACEVMAARGMAGAAFNAAREAALDAFIDGRIGFMAMAGLVEDTLSQVAPEFGLANATPKLDDVQARDFLARIRANEIVLRIRATR